MSTVVKALKAMGVSPDAVAELKAPADLALSTLTNTAPRLATAIRESRRDIAAIEAEKDLTDEAKQRRIAERRERLAETVGELDRNRREAGERLQSMLAEARGVERSVEEMLLDEQLLGRAWDRARRQIDAGADPLDLAQQAASDGDRVTLEALRQELPASGAGDVVEALDDIEAPLLSSPEVELRELEKVTTDAQTWATTAVNHAQPELQGGEVFELPTVDGGLVHIDAAASE